MAGRGFAVAAFAAVALVGLLIAAFAVPSRTRAAIPRDPLGRPDLQGIWSYATLTPFERLAEFADTPVFRSDEEAAAFARRTRDENNHDRRDGRGTTADVARGYNDFWSELGTRTAGTQTSLVVDPADGHIPLLTREAQQRLMAAVPKQSSTGADNPEERSLWERCLSRTLPMLPAGENNNVQIFQTRDYVVILNEMIHEARVIPLDGRPHGPVRQWLGDSRGRWEGDALVVDTINFTNKTNFRGSAENLHLVERYSRLDANTLLYEVRIEDPTTWTEPWTVSIPMAKSTGHIYEYACHEGNRALENILKGSRAQEALTVRAPTR